MCCRLSTIDKLCLQRNKDFSLDQPLRYHCGQIRAVDVHRSGIKCHLHGPRCAIWSKVRHLVQGAPCGPRCAIWSKVRHLVQGSPSGPRSIIWSKVRHLVQGAPSGPRCAIWSKVRHLVQGAPSGPVDIDCKYLAAVTPRGLFNLGLRYMTRKT